jgi:two-component system chemotaxis family response regulator WspR
MKKLRANILQQLIADSTEPVLVAQIDHPDWPVVLCNDAYQSLADDDEVLEKPFADVVEHMLGRDLALEISETVRAGHETSIAVELDGRDYLLQLKPLTTDKDNSIGYYAAYWRSGAGSVYPADGGIQQELLKAKRRIRDLSRDDAITGLLNENSFREVLAHDWAVAAREKSSLALVSFTLVDFDAYLEVFGRHATDSCQRRVAQAIRRCLRRASDVAARINSGDTDRMVVLSHASDEEGVGEFATKISTAVRGLGLHHPRSRVAKFVTVSYSTSVMQAGSDKSNAKDFLNSVLQD